MTLRNHVLPAKACIFGPKLPMLYFVDALSLNFFVFTHDKVYTAAPQRVPNGRSGGNGRFDVGNELFREIRVHETF